MNPLTLRPATLQDARLLWTWRNDAVVRSNSFSAREIPWEIHEGWLAATLHSPRSRLWIFEQEAVPVGQIRYDSLGEEIEIDYSIASEHRGKGLGTRLLQLSAPRACDELTGKRLIGVVFDANTASQRAFERAGFVRVATFWKASHFCIRFERRCGFAPQRSDT